MRRAYSERAYQRSIEPGTGSAAQKTGPRTVGPLAGEREQRLDAYQERGTQNLGKEAVDGNAGHSA
jgi:hypothetical protein